MYSKLFARILDSSIWLEPDATRLVWLTMLASMDECGFCQFASPANLAYRARVSLEDAQKALACLEGPDPNSSDPDNSGRRIERVPGGWIVLNATKFREIVTRSVAMEKHRVRVQRYRARKRAAMAGDGSVTVSDAFVMQSEEETTIETEKKGHLDKSASLLDDVAPSPEMVARGAMSELGISGLQLSVALASIARSLLETLSPDDALAAIANAWRAYKKAMPSLVWTYSGPQKFFEGDLWKDPNLWPWKDAHRPAAKNPTRYVDLTDPRYHVPGVNECSPGATLESGELGDPLLNLVEDGYRYFLEKTQRSAAQFGLSHDQLRLGREGFESLVAFAERGASPRPLDSAVELFRKAVDRLVASPFHAGQNDSGTKYNDFHQLFQGKGFPAPTKLLNFWLDDSRWAE